MALPPEVKSSINTNVNNDSVNENIVQFNNEKYIFDVFLINEKTGFRIPTGMIEDLTIVDDIYSVFPYGALIVKNDGNALESRYEISEQDRLNGSTSWTNFNFNVKGKDIVVVKIRPAFSQDIPFPASIWDFDYLFEIYDTDEITIPESQFSKFKILKLRHYREQMLEEVNLNWSTANLIPTPIDPRRATNLERGVLTGDAIKDILKTVYGETRVNFSDDWDRGAANLYYSSPAQNYAIDDLSYLLDGHVSSNTTGDFCILKLERNDTFSLIPLQVYYDRCNSRDKKDIPGSFTIDLFNLSNTDGSTSTNDSVLYRKRIKALKSNSLDYNAVFKSDSFLGLTNFSFLNTTVSDSMNELVTTPVHFVEIDKKQFSIKMADHNIAKIISDFERIYIKKMYGEDPTSLIPRNKTKLENKTVNNVFSVQEPKIREKIGSPTVMYKSLMYSTGINFNITGSLARKAARFVSIFNNGPVPDTGYQNILQGEWFITKISHTFSGNGYSNNISAVKPYSYKKLYNE